MTTEVARYAERLHAAAGDRHTVSVVAVATDYRSSDSTSAWPGLPAFSAWVCEPEDVPESEAA
jgi:hypothetical protein